MTTATSEVNSLNLKGLDELFKSGPSWLQHFRQEAAAHFSKQPFPTMSQEHWRRTDPERVRPQGQTLLVPNSTFEVQGCAQTPVGVKFQAIESGLEEVQSQLFTVAGLDRYNLFAALNGAAFQGGTHVVVDKDTSTGEGILTATHRFTGAGLAATRSYIEVGAGASATVAEVFEAGGEDVLANPVLEVHVKQGARLRYIFVNAWGPGSSIVPTIHVRVEKDAYFQMLFVGLGGILTKCFVESDLVGEGGKSEVLGIVLAHGRQHYDVDVQQNHRVGPTVSDVLFHVALTDRSRSIFGGNILCEPGAQKIDGYQQNRNLMLSDKARADSMPRLEIEANDVRCTHGASFSTYDADQRFYLQSRGLSQEEAEHLLVTGFFSEVIARLDHTVAEEWVERLANEKMNTVLATKK